ncbi:MAG: bla regulator protein BlaR1 [Polaribacter sp.]|jgi:bla regulator protein BlaR1
MKKHNYLLLSSFLIVFTLFFSNNTNAQEKKSFLQTRFNGFTETITKDFTKEKLNDLKNNLEKQSLFFSYSNLKFNKQKEIIKITIKVKNKRSNSEVSFNDNGKPIPYIKVGESNGIVIATTISTSDFSFLDINTKTVAFKSTKKNDPIYFLDGKITSSSSIKKINAKNIESISVLKGNLAIKKYGEKAKNGVIEIKTKRNKF